MVSRARDIDPTRSLQELESFLQKRFIEISREMVVIQCGTIFQKLVSNLLLYAITRAGRVGNVWLVAIKKPPLSSGLIL